MGQGPYGPGPIWAGPRHIWAKAHMGPGPFLVGRTPHQKKAPWKKESKLCFLCILGKQKRCATCARSFWRRYRAEISAVCQKTKVSVLRKNKLIHAESSFIAHWSRAHFCFMKFIPINVLIPYRSTWRSWGASESIVDHLGATGNS